MGTPRNQVGSVVSVLLLTSALSAAAQTNAEVNAGVQFNFSTPGARSLGLGGAFVALADDATAAYSNPAGLTALSRPEVSAEIRNWGFTNTYTDRGRNAGTPSGVGLDMLAGLRNGTDVEHMTGFSFGSAVYPHDRWAVAVYRHELANFTASYQTQGAFLDASSLVPGRIFPTRNAMSLDIANLGLAVAYHFNDDISFGAGISRYDFKLSSRTQRYGLTLAPGSTAAGTIVGPPLYTDLNIQDTESQSGDDSAIGFIAGILWQISTDLRLGAVYRQGPAFEVDATYSLGPATLSGSPLTKTARFDIPDVFGVGGAYLPTETVTVTFDYIRVRYSDLTRSVTNILTSSLQDDTRPYRVADVGEVHLGSEKIFSLPRGLLLAGRLGSWYDPAHKIRYLGEDAGSRALFQSGSGHLHGAAGIGLVGSRFQIDAAFDYSAQVRTASLSTVVRF